MFRYFGLGRNRGLIPKLSQLIQHCTRTLYNEKLCRKCVLEASSRSLLDLSK